MNKDEKIFDTAFRILEMLKLLSNKNLSKTDLINKLSSDDKNNVYSFEAFIKYFNTLNLIGLSVEKDNAEYALKNTLCNISLKKEEKNLLLEIFKNIDVLHNSVQEEQVQNFSYNLAKYLNDNQIDEDFLANLYACEKKKSKLSVNSNVLEYFKKVIKDKNQLKINYFSKNNVEKSIIAEIKEVKEKNETVFIKCYVSSMGRNKNICVDSILAIDSSPRCISEQSIKTAVTFEVYGRLASLYKLKPSEKVISFKKDSLTISNSEEDKDVLIRRLLKYGENCKIVSPQSVKDEFVSLVDEMIARLEVEYD